MSAERTRGLVYLVSACQALMLSALFWGWLALFVYWTTGSLDFPFDKYLAYNAALVVGLMAEAVWRSRLPDVIPSFDTSLLAHAPLTNRQVTRALGALLIFLILTKDRFASRFFLASCLPLLYAGLLAGNRWLPSFVARGLFGGKRRDRTLLVGPQPSDPSLMDWMRRQAELGTEISGIIPDDPDREGPLQKLGNKGELGTIIRRGGFHRVILLRPPASAEEAAELLAATEATGARLVVLFHFEDLFKRPIVPFMDGGFHFLTFRREPLENPVNRLLKRSMDLALALPAAALLLPPAAAAVWLLQRLQSPGPLFYTQTRAGLQNRAFPILKFRSMRVGHGEESRHASPSDERVFPAGKILRRFSIDELPQLLNVIRGEMSLVGPRPHMIEHNEQFARALGQYHVRALVKPGMTGLAQVRGFRGEPRTPDDIARRIESDVVYLENWSPALDLAILARTVTQLFSPPRSAH